MFNIIWSGIKKLDSRIDGCIAFVDRGKAAEEQKYVIPSYGGNPENDQRHCEEV